SRQNRREPEMSFGQKNSRSRNRRVSNIRQRRQQHLLDVKVRSRTATQHRVRRAMGVLSRVILVAALLGAGYAGARAAVKRLFFENADFQLKTIELQTDGSLQREQVLKAADLHEGENIFNVNLARVHDRIQQLPQTDEVQVVRKLPGEIDVSKGYCLLVTDKNRARVKFGFNDLQTQLRRLEQFLVYCDDSKQELGTVNLLVQRNIPVTFAEPPATVINDTIEPAVEPRI